MALLALIAIWSSCSAIDLRSRDASGVASLLGAAANATVSPDEFVWLESRGIFIDAVWGRPIVFLAKSGDVRDLYRANVTVTPSGQPLAVRFVSPLRATPLGDEATLISDGQRIGVATFYGGEPMSIAVYGTSDLGRPRVTDFISRRDAPTATVSVVGDGPLGFGFSEGGFVATSGDSVAVWDSTFRLVDTRGPAESTFYLSTDDRRAPWAWVASPSDAPRPALFLESVLPTARLPLADSQALVVDDGETAGEGLAIAYRRSFSVNGSRGGLVALNGALAELDVSLGTAIPASRTGFVPEGSIGKERMLGGLLGVPVAIGAQDKGRVVAPLPSSAPAVFAEPGASRGIDISGRLDDAIAFAPGLPVNGTRALGSVAIDDSGNVLVALAETSDVDAFGAAIQSIGMSQSIVFDATGSSLVLGDAARGFESIAGRTGALCFEHCSAPSIVFRRRKDEAWTISPPGTTPWSPEPKVKAMFHASAQVLGAEVLVHRLDAGRFSWSLVAGTKEKRHRFKGAFRSTLGERGQEAVLTISLGIGKRKGTRGLRMEGSTGLSFGSSDGSLAVSSDGGLAFVPPGTDLAEFTDASELPWSVRDAELTAAARVRGPLQVRGDLCVREGGVLVAEGMFDSHEATAQVLLNMGCDHVVSLDRGSEHPLRFLVGGETSPSEETRLVAFVRLPKPSTVVRR